MKKRLLLIALLGIFIALGCSCSKEGGQEQAAPFKELKQSPHGTGIEIDFDTTCTTDTIDLDA